MSNMIDREKVIEGLNDIKGAIIAAICYEDGYGSEHDLNCLDDAIELLKAEKKTKVVFKQYDGSIESECGNCSLYLDKAYSRCPKCNKELDWNGG